MIVTRVTLKKHHRVVKVNRTRCERSQAILPRAAVSRPSRLGRSARPDAFNQFGILASGILPQQTGRTSVNFRA